MKERHDWINTGKNQPFYYFDFSGYVWDIETIANSLAKINRFVGHSILPISVAEHSIDVSYILEKHFKRPDLSIYGLCHDIVESVVCDIPTPLKRYLHIKDPRNGEFVAFGDYENGVIEHFAAQFNLKPETLRMKDTDGMIVKKADNIAYYNEAIQLMPEGHPVEKPDYPYFVKVLSPNTAKILFIRRFHELWTNR